MPIISRSLTRLLFIFLCLLFILVSCKSSNEFKPLDEEKLCCKECETAFSQSPVAVSSEGAYCGSFTTGQPLNKLCTVYFEQNKLTVADCEQKNNEAN